MDTIFKQVDELMYHSLRPWLTSDISETDYALLTPKITEVKQNSQSKYLIEYYRATNSKAKYYFKFISTEIASFLNKAILLINETDNELYKRRLYDEIMKTELPKRLTDLIEIIKEHHFFTEYINPKKVNFEVNPEHQTNTFVIQYLKVSLVKLYLDLQELYHHLDKELPINEVDIYNRFFNLGLPDNSFLKDNPEYVKEQQNPTKETVKSIRKVGISRLSFTFNKIEAEADKITDLFKYLKENNFIAKENQLASFKRAFSGNEVYEQVVWSGTANELFYLVDLLHNKHKLIEPISRNYWKVVVKIFIKSDGTQFIASKLGEGRMPEHTAEALEKAVKLLT